METVSIVSDSDIRQRTIEAIELAGGVGKIVTRGVELAYAAGAKEVQVSDFLTIIHVTRHLDISF